MNLNPEIDYGDELPAFPKTRPGFFVPHPTERLVTLGSKTALAIRYKTRILNPDGSVAKERPWKNNLILDQGLNLMPSLGACHLFGVAVVGTGTDPVKRDSGAVTFARSGTTVTASANFFGSGDVGRMIKFDSGEEVYINAFTDLTHVETVTSGTIAAVPGTIWYVNQTGLVTETKRTQTYRVESGDNVSTFDAVDTYTHQRTFQFSAEGGAVTYREIGWSYTMSAGGNLFGRDLIPGAGDALTTGQQYQVVVQMTVKVSPITPQAVGDVGSGGFNTAGNFMLESLFNALSTVDSSGGSTGGLDHVLEPGVNVPITNVYCRVASADWTQQATVTTSGVTQPAGTNLVLASIGYVSGTFRLDHTGTLAVGSGNGSIFGFCFSRNSGAGTPTQITTSLKFTSTQTKANTHTLTVTYRKQWGRTLVN